jgi:hypothetical protein
VLWAYGESEDFSQGHGNNKSPITINFASGAVTEQLPVIKIVHGVLMFLSFGLLMPIGVIAARFGKDAFPAPKWFHIHRGVQTAALALALIGFALAIKFTIDAKVDHFSVLHSKIGLGVFIGAILQPFIAFIRPAKGEKNRALWEAVHKSIGWLAVLLAILVILLGLKKIGAGTILLVLYSVLAGLFCFAFVILEARLVSRSTKGKSTQYDMLTNN